MKTSALSHPTASSTDFRHGTVAANGVRLHYVERGDGPPVLLLPGWPQSWYAWRHVMVRLAAAGRRVIAVDPRGMGDSERPATGYDLATVAADIHAFAAGLGLLDNGPIDVAGHDVGAWIGYAYAADWPGDVRRLAMMDALVPGFSSPRTDLSPEEANLRAWHFGFNRLDDLPETLIAGRERAFLTWLFRAKAVKRSVPTISRNMRGSWQPPAPSARQPATIRRPSAPTAWPPIGRGACARWRCRCSRWVPSVVSVAVWSRR